MRLLAAIALFWPATAMAQDWATRSGDVALSDTQMQVQVIGQALTFYDNGVSRYVEDGSYSYEYDGGATAFGSYTLSENSVLCTVFQNGFERCDMIVRNGERLVVITEKGDRYPIRDSSPE